MKKQDKILNLILEETEEILSSDLTHGLEDYFLEEDNDKFLDDLEERDFSSLDDDKILSLRKTYELIRKVEDNSYLRKYTNLLFKIYKGKAAYVLCGRWFSRLYTESSVFIEAGVTRDITAALHAYILGSSENGQALCNRNYKIIFDICRENKEDIVKALDYVEPLYKCILLSLYCYVEDDDKKEQFISCIEKYLTERINDVYKNAIVPEELVRLQKLLLKDEKFCLPEDLENSILKLTIDGNLFRIFACISGMNSRNSIVLRNVYNLLINRNSNLALQTLFESIFTKEYEKTHSLEENMLNEIVEGMNNAVEVEKADFLLWFMEIYSANIHTYKVIKELILKDKQDYKNVVNRLDCKNRFIISAMALEEFDDDEFMPILKKSLCELFEYTLNERSIQSSDEQVRAIEEYINGTKSFEEIYDVLSSNKCLKGQIYFGSDLYTAVSYREDFIKKNTDLYEKIVLIMAALEGSQFIYKLGYPEWDRVEKYNYIFNILEDNNVDIKTQMYIYRWNSEQYILYFQQRKDEIQKNCRKHVEKS